MEGQGNEERENPERGAFVQSIGEDAEVIRKALSDTRLQDTFIAALDEDPQLVAVLAKVAPELGSVAADWSCCRGNHAQIDLEEMSEFFRSRTPPTEGGGGD